MTIFEMMNALKVGFEAYRESDDTFTVYIGLCNLVFRETPKDIEVFFATVEENMAFDWAIRSKNIPLVNGSVHNGLNPVIAPTN